LNARNAGGARNWAHYGCASTGRGSMGDKSFPLRLAMRVEGHSWNAYAAKLDSMDDAIWIGSIAMRFIEDNEERKQTFLALMQEGFADVLEELFGQRPTWNEPIAAPERERTHE
jgi:hypothetical protein